MTLRKKAILRAAFLLSLAAAASLALACDVAVWGNGESASETRELTDFTAIELDAGIDVEIEVTGEHEGPPVRGPTPARLATLRCDANLLGRIRTEIAAGTLHVHTNGDDIELRPRTACELVLQTPRLESVRISGPSTLVAHGRLEGLRRIELDGPAELDAEGIATDTLDVRVSGPAELVLAGTAERIELDLAGPVDLDADQLSAAVVELTASGPVDAGVRASDRVVLDIEGPADIVVHGDPDHRDVDVDGPADVRFE